MADDTTITPKLLDQLLANFTKPEDLLGEEGLFKQLKKALIERALGAELTGHLGYTVPRDHSGTFEPQLIPKGQTRFDGFDDKIVSLGTLGGIAKSEPPAGLAAAAWKSCGKPLRPAVQTIVTAWPRRRIFA